MFRSSNWSHIRYNSWNGMIKAGIQLRGTTNMVQPITEQSTSWEDWQQGYNYRISRPTIHGYVDWSVCYCTRAGYSGSFTRWFVGDFHWWNDHLTKQSKRSSIEALAVAEHVCFREMEFRDNTMSAIRMEDVIKNRRGRTNNINHYWVASLDDVSSITSFGGFFDTISEECVFGGCDENETQISLLCPFTMRNHGKSMRIHQTLFNHLQFYRFNRWWCTIKRWKVHHFMALP